MLSQDEANEIVEAMNKHCHGIETDTMKAFRRLVEMENRKQQLRIMFAWGIACTLLGLGIYTLITL